MRKNSVNLILCLLVVWIISTGCFATSSTTVQGYVRTGSGEPVAGAKVSFGGVAFPDETMTDEKGFYKITARHRFTQMLYLTVSKEGFATETEKFPGFAAPDGDKNIEMMRTIPSRR